jgi:uncharacterized membrane protein (Fun14 family)
VNSVKLFLLFNEITVQSGRLQLHVHNYKASSASFEIGFYVGGMLYQQVGFPD